MLYNFRGGWFPVLLYNVIIMEWEGVKNGQFYVIICGRPHTRRAVKITLAEEPPLPLSKVMLSRCYRNLSAQ